MSGLGNMVDLEEFWGRRAREIGSRPAGTPGGEAPRGGLEESAIRKAIESEIVPRLLLAHGNPNSTSDGRDVSSEDVAELARIVIAHDLETTRGFVSAVRSTGLSLEDVLLELVAPAARLLGELWLADRATFSEVSVGLGRLQRLALELGLEAGEPLAGEWRGRVLLAPTPGEQHGLGLRLVADFLCGDGWGVDYQAVATGEELERWVASAPYVMVGLTISNDRLLAETAELINVLRRRSCNPDVIVLVGGACAEDRDLAEAVGADSSPRDARAVVRYMQNYHDSVIVGRVRSQG